MQSIEWIGTHEDMAIMRAKGIRDRLKGASMYGFPIDGFIARDSIVLVASYELGKTDARKEYNLDRELNKDVDYDLDPGIRRDINQYQNLPSVPGWVCPKCGAVYSPYTHECWRCSPPPSITVTCSGWMND